MSWANLRAAFPALSPSQLHRLLTQYQLASAMGPMSAWEPGAQDSPAAFKSGEASPPAGAQNSGVARGLLDPQVPGSPGGGTGQDTRGGRRPRAEARLCPQARGSGQRSPLPLMGPRWVHGHQEESRVSTPAATAQPVGKRCRAILPWVYYVWRQTYICVCIFL